MLKFVDKAGNLKFLLKDDSTQPIDIDKLIIDQSQKEDDDEPEEDKKETE